MTDESNISSGEARDALDPKVGSGTPDTAPWEDVQVDIPWLRRQPVVALVLAIVLPSVAGAVTTAASSAPVWATLLLGSVATIATVGGRLAWKAVTPVDDPRLADDLPLSVDGHSGNPSH